MYQKDCEKQKICSLSESRHQDKVRKMIMTDPEIHAAFRDFKSKRSARGHIIKQFKLDKQINPCDVNVLKDSRS